LRSEPGFKLLVAQRKHPSALGSFDQIAAAAKGKRIVMFMDYDGTLSPIVTDPDMAFMTPEVTVRCLSCSLIDVAMKSNPLVPAASILLYRVINGCAQMRAAVRNVAKHFPTAIVTGRCIEKVRRAFNTPRSETHYMYFASPEVWANQVYVSLFLLLRTRSAAS
jgi:hypothetical protein